jgi:hypothetical protein
MFYREPVSELTFTTWIPGVLSYAPPLGTTAPLSAHSGQSSEPEEESSQDS